MIILALDTSAVAASVAVADIENGKILSYAQQTVKNKLTHSEVLMPMIDSTLSLYGCRIEDIGLFALSVGPGSFTGVRIGAATIKGLAYGDKLCCGVSTLEALACNISGFNGILCPVMDARRSQLYNALFENGERLTEDRCIDAAELETELISLGKPVCICGDGAELFLSLCRQLKPVMAPAVAVQQNGLSVALAAAMSERRVKAGELSPLYLRPSQAEREYQERMEKKL